MNRERELAALRAEARGAPWDVLVVGGGIAGAGIALEAARAGARTLLVEARDFAGGTSSRSSKLVHGGLRYLAQGRIGLTREALRERNLLMREAAGLVRPLRFLLPVRRGDANGRLKLGLGLALYDLLAGLRSRRWHRPAELLECAPMLAPDGLVGGWSYADAEVDDARLVVRVLSHARDLGAMVINHLEAAELRRDGSRLIGARLLDMASGQRLDVDARCVINATGAWTDVLRGQIGRPPVMRPLRGSHLLFADWRLPVSQAVAIFHPRDGRPVYALPWEGATLVGTTDLDHRQDLSIEPAITRPEFDYLLEAVQGAFPSVGLGEADVMSTWAGVRPVVSSRKAVDPSRETREHMIVDEDGLVTVTGGKLTTFRSTAVQALRTVAHRVPALGALSAGQSPGQLFDPLPADIDDRLAALPASQRARWIARYGSRAPTVLAEMPASERVTIGHTDVAWAELRWACRHEAIGHLDDLMLRRTRLGLLMRDGAYELLDAIEPIARAELGWAADRWRDECERYVERVARCYGRPRAADPADPAGLEAANG